MDPRTVEPTLTTPIEDAIVSDVHDGLALERDVEFIVNDCFFAVGQAIGLRKTMDYDAVVWLHDHFRAKFLSALQAFGNRWLQDRHNVTAVAFMFGERAVRHAGEAESISLEAVRQAAAEVQRYCNLHGKRARRAMGDDAVGRLAGYYCDGYGW